MLLGLCQKGGGSCEVGRGCAIFAEIDRRGAAAGVEEQRVSDGGQPTTKHRRAGEVRGTEGEGRGRRREEGLDKKKKRRREEKTRV